MFRIKQRVGLWKFSIVYFPGRTNFFADATSRNPSQPPDPLEATEKRIASVATAAIAVTLDDIVAAGKGDPQYLATKLLLAGDPNLSPAACGPYHAIRNKIYASGDHLLYDDRMIIPVPLRPKVLQILHSAHQGISNMTHRASQTVFWHGLTNDIARTRAKCRTCNLIALLQSQVPVEQSLTPSTPFEAIAVNYFDLYLVIVHHSLDVSTSPG